MSKREREDERPDETSVTVIDLQATIYARNRPTFVTFANALLTVTGFSMVSFTQYLVV